jgi:hypothetical protein
MVAGDGAAGGVMGIGGGLASALGAGAGILTATGALAPIGAILGAAAVFTLKSVAPVAKAAKSLAERSLELSKFLETAQIGFESPIANMQDPAIDKPHIWSTTVPRSFNITFPLYNIISQPESTAWYSNIIKNWELCHLLTYQNLYNKRNLFTGIPPVFYEIDIPGVHYSKAGYVNNLQILNVGNIRKLTLPLEGGNKDVNVPDAYIVNMAVTDFFIPSKNFMSSLCQRSKGNLTRSLQNADQTGHAGQEQPENPLTGLPENAFQNGMGGGGIK